MERSDKKDPFGKRSPLILLLATNFCNAPMRNSHACCNIINKFSAPEGLIIRLHLEMRDAHKQSLSCGRFRSWGHLREYVNKALGMREKRQPNFNCRRCSVQCNAQQMNESRWTRRRATHGITEARACSLCSGPTAFMRVTPVANGERLSLTCPTDIDAGRAFLLHLWIFGLDFLFEHWPLPQTV